MLQEGEVSATTAIDNLLSDAKMGQDFFIQLGSGMKSRFKENGHLALETMSAEFSLHDNAVSQLATRYKIPVGYANMLVRGDEWMRELAGRTFNEFCMNSNRERLLMRAVGQEIRGVLSDKYKILDSFEIISTFLEEAIAQGARFAGGHNSGLNMWLEVVVPTMINVETVNNGSVDIIFGGRFKTSDFGCGEMNIRTFFMNAVCTNGLVGETVLRERHIGEKLPEGFTFSRQTHAAASKKIQLMVKDMTKALFSEQRILGEVAKIQKASGVEINAKSYLERMFKENKLFRNEVEEAEMVMLNNRLEDGIQGASTLWKLTQSISAIARSKEPLRQRELIEVAGSLLPEVSTKQLAIA